MSKAKIALCGVLTMLFVQAGALAQTRTVENLDRGLAVMKNSDGIYLSWRLRADEDYNTEYIVYRDGEEIARTQNTNYIDDKGNMDSWYQIAPADNADKKSDWKKAYPAGKNYFDIVLDKPDPITLPDRTEPVQYEISDATCGDCDGDGEYEIIQMWAAANQDNSKGGYTGNVIIDAYKLDGTKLWRIDLGKNIRAGAHYTQMIAADFDSDGICELALKTAPGSIDGTGKYVTEASLDENIKTADNTADYRDASGRVLEGPEYFTVFSGKDGSALDTIYYPVPRGEVKAWGDEYGNRVDRFLGCAAYLDGVKPSIVTWRGYYTRMTANAYDLVDKRLVHRSSFDTNEAGEDYMSQGNHSILAADVDNDGKDEVISGAMCLDDDLTIKWCSHRGHGDAHHLGWYNKDSKTPLYFSVHEQGWGQKPDKTPLDAGMTVYDASSGQELFHTAGTPNADGTIDTARGIMGNFGIDGDYQIWAIGTKGYTYKEGEFVELPVVGSNNFRIFWDGDIYDELMDGRAQNGYAIISKYSQSSGTFYNITDTSNTGGVVINASKCTPVLQADLFGDWREEFILRIYGSEKLRVYTSNIYTDNKLYTLMHDTTYRMGVAAENVGYNQPPHIGYYLDANGDDNRSQKPNVQYASELPDKEIPETPPVQAGDVDERMILDMDGSIPSTNTRIVGGTSIGGPSQSGIWSFSGAPWGNLITASEYHPYLNKATGFEAKDGNCLLFATVNKSSYFTACDPEKSINDKGVLTFDMSIPVSFSDNGSNSRGNGNSEISIGDGIINALTMKYMNTERALYLNDELFYTFADAADAQKWRNFRFEIDVQSKSVTAIMTDVDGTKLTKQINFAADETGASSNQINTFKVSAMASWGFVAMDNLMMYANSDIYSCEADISETTSESVTAIITSSSEISARAILAVYNDGVLENTYMKDVSLSEGENTVKFDGVTLNEQSDKKLFIWNNGEEIIPISMVTK